jgi:dTDP-4-dehydrorhamnose reductase
LIVGAGGQVGEKVGQAALVRGHEVVAAYRSRVPRTKFSETICLDKTSELDVGKAISRVRPNVVVDAAALHNVDYCETHPEEAISVNRDGTAFLARASERLNARFIFISTDFVFDGSGAPYTEESAPRPLSWYARSKLEGEKAALAGSQNSVVCRPAVIYSWVNSDASQEASTSGKPLNFGAWLVFQLKAKKEVRIVTDQITSPTLADDLAGAILAIAESSNARGIYHTAGSTALSRFDFSIRVARKLNLTESLIQPIDSTQLKQVAKRPLNSSLLSDRIARELGYSMMNIDQSLNKFFEASRLA